MEKHIITISREFGSGGRTIGKLVAEHLGIPCYDAELLQKLAAESGFDENYVREAGEYTPGGFLASAFTDRSFGLTNEDLLWKLQYRIIRELAEKESCVIVGRCAELHPARPHRLLEGLCPRRPEVPGRPHRASLRRAGEISRIPAEGEGQAPRRLLPLTTPI